jgi:hypothetical protein
MSDRTQIDFIELGKLVLGGMDTEENFQRFSIALQCIANRLRYCRYHFDLVQTHTTRALLIKDRLQNSPDEDLSVRDVYEANTAAFLHNLHAMIDSFPYLLNLIHREVEDIDDISIGWSEKFVAKYKRLPFHPQMGTLFGSKHFALLKGYANHGKHKFLIRIINNYDTLLFEDFQFLCDGNKELTSALVVKDFMVETYDVLIPDFVYLINSAVSSTPASRHNKALKS